MNPVSSFGHADVNLLLNEVDFDEGITQGGSSGSPILNENLRVVGQLHGGYHPADICDWTQKYYGRMDMSWIGGGTNDSRLSNWLDPRGTGLTAIDSYKPTEILPLCNIQSSIDGPGSVCTSSLYSVSGYPLGITVTWTFQRTSGTSPTLVPSTSTQSCTVQKSANSAFEGYLKATVKADDITIANYSKFIYGEQPFVAYYWDGGTYMDILWDDDNWVTAGNNIIVESSNFQGKTVRTSLSSSPNNYTVLNVSSLNEVQFIMPNLSSGEYLTLWVTDEVGSCEERSFIFYCNSQRRINYNLMVSALDNMHYRLSLIYDTDNLDNKDGKKSNIGGEEKLWACRVYDANSLQLVSTFIVKGDSYVVDTSSWKSGVYIIRAHIENNSCSAKFTIK